MPQVTIYLPDDLLDEIKGQARQAKMSLSAYMTRLARRSVRPQAWPAGFWELAGSCPDLEEPEELVAESAETL